VSGVNHVSDFDMPFIGVIITEVPRDTLAVTIP
jgi:hypothetical protein